ncbi:hypothetical protein A9Q79_09855 [Methylophaga sp. 42_25_T18]|nr:hypothetical protein A9Q79_09855 [Methylophaga sp. 42_25_T18]OUR89940.1 hypothetical protein A9Q92_00050 [Methylophaga sp. 42_8_T64]
MKGIIIMIATGLSLTINVFAETSNLEFLAGVEAGIDTATAMSDTDLEHTQHVLSAQPIGVAKSWYNEGTSTLYNIKIVKYFQQDKLACVNYDLMVQHNESLDIKPLTACLNHQGNWIASLS